ncbi:myotilin isoform X2 [Fukomys damarensis]|uniref:Myotilin n=2 Tax=Fukomys damarensis TaxID=885580 RepID=A0A091CNV3_FUKDA|nr:myotilin isoform X2 [Fukomys damarensis]XP_010612421.1 myotilin isoform X2 [Fukomys damarensis]XP_019061622.1 myotilin isoform X2 [Fukomys damarensis]KFO19208.1 Myotilin [Fukomys damarensis]
MQSPCSSLSGSTCDVAPVFTKHLQDISTIRGQCVKFECRVRATATVQVRWYREKEQIASSDDFQILRKKASLSSIPEEVCTLIITEAFPEDSGEFNCVAENEAGTAVSTAKLFVSAEGKEVWDSKSSSKSPMSKLSPKMISFPCGSEKYTKDKNPDDSPINILTTLPKAAGCDEQKTQVPKQDFCITSGNSSKLQSQWSNILQEEPTPPKPGAQCSHHLSKEGQNKVASDFLQPSIISGLQSPLQDPALPETNHHSDNSPSSSIHQLSMFNYERPKHFLQSQNPCGSRLQPPGPETSSFSSQTKQSSIIIQPRQCTEQRFSASSTLSSHITMSSSAFPASQQPAGSSPGQRVTASYNQSPASFLSSILPSQPDYSSSKIPSTVNANYQQPSDGQPVNAKPSQNANAKPTPRTPDHEIQGSKEALIQDLERKLKCKDTLLHNGNQRLTYEEKMARRLLGPQNAAAVFQAQNSDAHESPQRHNAEHTRLQVPTAQVRSRSSSRGDVNDQDAIQEKFYPPRFIQVPENMSMEEGRFCRMDFKVSGLPAPDVSWYLNGRSVQSDELHKMIVSEKGFHSLIFEVVRASDAGPYVCVAKNRAGEATFTVQLDVLAKEHKRAPMFIYKPQSKKVLEGDSVKLECQISAIPPPKIFWKRNNEMVQFNTDRISLYHDNTGRITLLIKDVNKKDAGWYTVSAVNEAGVTTCNTRLDVTARANQTLPAPKQLRVRPTFSKYLALNGRGLDVKQAFNPEGEFQRLAAQSGLYESEEL